MKKSGQITIFVIIGIIILFIILGFLFMLGSFGKDNLETKEEKIIESTQLAGDVQNYVESCIEKTGEDALIFVGKQGGYYDLPEFSDNSLNLPYYFYDDQDISPNKEIVEEELAKYMSEMLFFCVEKFTYFKEKGYEIEQKEIQTETSILDSMVKFKISFPVYVEKGSVGKELLIFEMEIKSRLGTVLEAISEFMSIQKEEPLSVCVSCLNEIGQKNDFKMEMGPAREDPEKDDEIVENLVFVVIDEKVLINNEPFEFKFMNKYEFEEWED